MEKSTIFALSQIPFAILGLLELVFGLIAYTFVGNINVGGFYAGLAALITAVLGLFMKAPVAQGFYIALSIITFIVSIVGTIVDGIAFAVVSHLKACDVSDRCYCVDSQATFYYDDDETYGSGTCFYYTAGDRLNTDDCSALLDKYPDSIHASYVCCLVLIFVSFVYSIFGCSTCCCLKLGTPIAVHDGSPAIVQMGTPQVFHVQQVAQPNYGQPSNGQPYYGQPPNGQPVYGQPNYGQPVYGQPVYGQTYNGQPNYGQPMIVQPLIIQPANGQPAYGDSNYAQVAKINSSSTQL